MDAHKVTVCVCERERVCVEDFSQFRALQAYYIFEVCYIGGALYVWTYLIYAFIMCEPILYMRSKLDFLSQKST